ncbi:MAG: redoxin domain-containing protein [Thermoflexus sp.]|jgi:hypothetical protein|nr:redoxin domain-containing protein [Thermoflexus sp.]MDT7948166.1 redoxin domain-containing protein [Thermoflexus sp.]
MDTFSLILALVGLLVLFHSVLLWRILVWLSASTPPVDPPRPIPRVGEPAPLFRLRSFEGEQVESAALAHGPMALLFVSSDCSACAEFLEATKRLPAPVRRFLVGICEGEEAACRDLQSAGASEIRWLHDPEGDLRRQYGFNVLPATAVLDRFHRLHAWGWIPLEDLERILEELNEEQE